MQFSQSRLHQGVLVTDDQRKKAMHDASLLMKKRQKAAHKAKISLAVEGMVSVTLTAVTAQGNFDAYINIQFQGAPPASGAQIVVDTGNSMLIVPHWESIEGLPGYKVLGNCYEPWGCPVNVVQGPILIPTADGGVFTIDNCIFFACKGNNALNQRTGNFGAGCVTPWSANPWSSGLPGVVLQAPLSYNTSYPFAEFIYNAQFAADHSLLVSDTSVLNLYTALPEGYTMMKLLPNLEWMSLIPQNLTIGNVATGWPGIVNSPIAMIDLGGGPVFLSDPSGHIYNKQWPDPVSCPWWASTSTNCNCISDDLMIQLGDGVNSYTYTIDTGTLPVSVQGLTGVFCQVNSYMMGQQGMNAGGISALFNDTLVDYGGAMVGFKPRNALKVQV